ncbi:ComEC/Rec2 family competence protein [Mucilaginibacter aquaedulcis]|uniref:ComEC/Rec2 family competence protein n=1 Tax=Mucilaginibacter aquaedulcis TaxID=1187081 RepID=UPI0025B5CDDD|nr:MBL fold metallo-hydrolase [Mucilaginibacter aquaedulcis]MDN3548763.1 MBL fold metallo-hydrolase [Mucilaginibacter aquaedulcis]
MRINFLPAYNGDAICINYVHQNVAVNILIDGGTKQTYQTKGKKNTIISGSLKLLVEAIRERKEKVDLLILTHIDDDHVGGILKWFEIDQGATGLIGKVWFNSGKIIAGYLKEPEIKIPELSLVPQDTTDTGINQGVTFEKVIREAKIWDEGIITQGQCLNFKGSTFKILSPSKDGLKALHDKWFREASDSMTSVATDYDQSLAYYLTALVSDPDGSIHNGSSIAFIWVYDEKNYIFLADAHAETLINGFKIFEYDQEHPIPAEVVKLSHHGSNRNISLELLEMIDTDQFVVTTNGNKHGHPDKKGLAKILKSKTNPLIRFNYPNRIDDIFTAEDRKFIGFRTDSALDGIVIEEE